MATCRICHQPIVGRWRKYHRGECARLANNAHEREYRGVLPPAVRRERMAAPVRRRWAAIPAEERRAMLNAINWRTRFRRAA